MGNCLESCRETLANEEAEASAPHRFCMKCKHTFWESTGGNVAPIGSVQRVYVCARCLGGLCASCRGTMPAQQRDVCLHCKPNAPEPAQQQLPLTKSTITPATTPNGSKTARRLSLSMGTVAHQPVVQSNNSSTSTNILVPLLAAGGSTQGSQSQQPSITQLGGSTPTSASGSLPGMSRLSSSHGGIQDGGAPTLHSVSSSSSLRRHVPQLRYRKICILGPACVGKSSIVTRYCEDRFSSYHTPNTSSQTQKTFLHDRVQYSLTLLDTGGQDDAPAFQPEWSIGTHAYVLVFSLTDYSSFEALHPMYEQLIEVQHNSSNVPIILCGNKSDVSPAERQVSWAEGQEKAQRWNCCGYVEVSAKVGTEVSTIFTTLLQTMCEV